MTIPLPFPADRIPDGASLAARPRTTNLRAGVRVLDITGLPADVEVRASVRRRRTVSAYREGGRTIVLVPARMSQSDVRGYVTDLVSRLEARRSAPARTDADLQARATDLSRRYLGGRAVPTSVRWSDEQRTLWGSCTSAEGTIRLSSRLRAMPDYVVDAVLVHELVHLLVPHHGGPFRELVSVYPRLAEAEAFLAGVSHADNHGKG